MNSYDFLVKLFIFGVPLLLAVPLHEAAHGFVALYCGDQTAKKAGRLTLNPLPHVDLFGTIMLPGLLVLSGVPFLFGYAKPVPVHFAGLRNPRRDMVLVAAAGPLMNLVLAVISGLLVHGLFLFPEGVGKLLREMLQVSVLMNVSLAVFNMLPIPPLDGGRVAVGILPDIFARRLARLERYGLLILLGLIVLLPTIGNAFGIQLNLLSWLIADPIHYLVTIIWRLTGLT